MAYEAIIYNREGKAVTDAQGVLDRGWALNNFEQCTFTISGKAELARMGYYEFGNYLVIHDSQMDIWGGYFDPPQSWNSDQAVTIQAYSAERLLQLRTYPGAKLLTGSSGAIYQQIIEAMNNVAPEPTLIRPGNIYDSGKSMQETISAKPLLDDVTRVASRSGNDFYLEPVVQDGILRFEAHWYAARGAIKEYALEVGVNIEAKENLIEYQGDIWNYVYAYGNAATWEERATAIAIDQESIERYGLRMYALSVNSNIPLTVQSAAEAFVAENAKPRRTFNLTIGGKRVLEDALMNAYKTVRIGDVLPLILRTGNVETWVRVLGMTHHGGNNLIDTVVREVNL